LEAAAHLIQIVGNSISAPTPSPSSSPSSGRVSSACALMQTLTLDTVYKNVIIQENATIYTSVSGTK
jgi:hypothetical protein